MSSLPPQRALEFTTELSHRLEQRKSTLTNDIFILVICIKFSRMLIIWKVWKHFQLSVTKNRVQLSKAGTLTSTSKQTRFFCPRLCIFYFSRIFYDLFRHYMIEILASSSYQLSPFPSVIIWKQ